MAVIKLPIVKLIIGNLHPDPTRITVKMINSEHNTVNAKINLIPITFTYLKLFTNTISLIHLSCSGTARGTNKIIPIGLKNFSRTSATCSGFKFEIPCNIGINKKYNIVHSS